MTTTLTPELFKTVDCPTCKQPAGMPCIIKRRLRYQHWDYHIPRQTRSIAKRQRERDAE